MLDKLTELLVRFERMGVPSYDISVYRRGTEVYRRMHGCSDYEKTKPIGGKERYNIYSCSKPITVTAAMTLFEKGKFKLEDKLSDYMPEFSDMKVSTPEGIVPAERPIFIENLFTMSAGFNYSLNSPGIQKAKQLTNGRCPTRETIRRLAEEPLHFQPGSRYSYSLCHDVLAALVEEIAGMTFGEYVKKTIFEPCGMDDSAFIITPEEREALCAQYRFDANEGVYKPCGHGNVFIVGPEYESGGAGCVSTVDDYMRFLEALRCDRILKAETRRLMTFDRLTPAQRAGFADTLRPLGYGYGLGLRCPCADDSPDKLPVGPFDFGWGGAAAAYLMVDNKHETTLYYAQHVLGSPNQTMRNEIPAIIAEEFGE